MEVQAYALAQARGEEEAHLTGFFCTMLLYKLSKNFRSRAASFIIHAQEGKIK